MGGAQVTDDLQALEGWAAGLLTQLEPAARGKLARELGQALRRSQQKRITAQRNPDGSKYTPRKQRDLRGKKGRIKRKGQMFQKMRAARFMKVQDSGDSITVGFTGRVARIARVHQYGLKDRAERGATTVSYRQRRLLGLTNDEMEMIREGLLAHLGP